VTAPPVGTRSLLLNQTFHTFNSTVRNCNDDSKNKLT